ncbi:cytochrome C [Psychrosphaera sp. B3R10]|uniref:Vgb family protein n=1 Tax=unclassified Psychrosphaera TaxID=2641570 RepID=UPI001C0924AC|nr:MULTISPECIES: cytochrome C [unclassified Psychrosphaera]MBU2883820.1 cytochrome C [Psychrosphaera sp. I2R16]MBU2990994.1 cytochrome C [Psychrosphaera sp. B3R10]
MRKVIFSLSFLLSVFASSHAAATNVNNKDNEHAYAKGQKLVERLCTSCHRRNLITRSSGYTYQQWQSLTRTMIDLSEQPETEQLIFSYLAKAYPPNNHRSPDLVSGDVQIFFEQWHTPTLGQRARDPVEAPDGSIWWAGQRANLIGRIDSDTGEMKEYSLPPNAMPHSVTPDKDGNIWYTGNKNGSIGKLDPKSGEITVFKMPDKNAKDPHTATFDSNGILWFTAQHSNMIGRLDPNTGDIKLVTMPTEHSRPYGIKIDADGNPWVACNGSNCLVKVNPSTMQLKEIKLPDAASKVRRLDIDNAGNIWFVNSALGRLGRYSPDTSAIKEWPSPSGEQSHPYAIAVVDGIVWYNESGKRPDALVRFDPTTEMFQSWAIPSGEIYAGIIRHMRATQSGDLLIHQSSTNKIIRVKITQD